MTDLTIAFDYDKLPPADADRLRALAPDLRARVKAFHADFKRAGLDIGEELLAAKAQLPHGTFARWCLAELDLEARTAQNFMAAARLLRALPPAKSETVSHLPAATLYALAAPSLPETVRAALVDRAAAGERIAPAAVRLEARAERQKPLEQDAAARLTDKQRRDKAPSDAKKAKDPAAEMAQNTTERDENKRADDEVAQIIAGALSEAARARVLELLDTVSIYGALRESLKGALTRSAPAAARRLPEPARGGPDPDMWSRGTIVPKGGAA
jgi:hypothetical protein